MSIKEHGIITLTVLAVVMGFIFIEGCTHVDHNNSPTWEYPNG
jgi:hypothetical protein